jgi:hypothetical protein
MKRPRRVKVLGRTYTIEFLPTGSPILVNDDDENCLGRVDHNAQQIAVDDKQVLEAQQDTVLHEVLHAIENTLNLDVEENTIHLFATGVLAVLRENPEVTRFLLSKPRK